MIWRDDDIAWDSDLNKLKEIQSVFEKYDLKEMYSVIPFGKGIYDGEYDFTMAEKDIPTGNKPITSNKKVCEFISNSLDRGHRISLHGWRHTRIVDFTTREIESNMREAKEFLEETFDTCITHFVAPFNCFDDRVLEVCHTLDMEILGVTGGFQLEKAIQEHIKPNNENFAWFHFWRINPKELDEYFSTLA